jgi:glycerophosphoryl diester phosphodiesterase
VLRARTQRVLGLDSQGHRGVRCLATENTLAGFALTLGIGVTTLELDIAVTRDDVLVISHDPALNPDITRGPDGRVFEARDPVIRTLTFDEQHQPTGAPERRDQAPNEGRRHLPQRRVHRSLGRRHDARAERRVEPEPAL